MPNEFQNRDQMLNSIAQNAAVNTPLNPPVVEQNGVSQTYNPVTPNTTPGSMSTNYYAPVEESPLDPKPNHVSEPEVSTFRGTTEPTQSPVVSGVPASEYETMTPPPVSGANYNMSGADSYWKTPTVNSQVEPNADITPKKETPIQPTSDSGMIVDDDIDMDQFKKEQEAHAAKDAEEYEKKKVQFNITMNDVKATMPSITGEELDKKSIEMMGNLKKYRTNLIVNEGMTPEEADEATRNRMKHLGTKINNEWIDQHPHTGVITVNKEDADKLELTQEEHDKLVTTKSIKLVCIENKELESLKVIDAPSVTKDKLQYIRKSNNAGARYSIPLPAFGDYVTFHGATARALMQEGRY